MNFVPGTDEIIRPSFCMDAGTVGDKTNSHSSIRGTNRLEIISQFDFSSIALILPPPISLRSLWVNSKAANPFTLIPSVIAILSSVLLPSFGISAASHRLCAALREPPWSQAGAK